MPESPVEKLESPVEIADCPLEKAEWKILGMAISDARMRAAAGELAAGYACLVAGLKRMEEFVTGGESWAGDLLSAYRQAADSYEESSGARLDSVTSRSRARG